MKILKIVSTAVLLGFAGVALAQTAPGLTVGVSAPASVQTGTARTLATVSLRAGGSGVELASLPLSLGYAAETGVITAAAPLQNCKLSNAGGTALNTGVNAITSSLGSQDILVKFDQTLVVPANGTVVLSFVCDVPASVPNGSAVATAIFPASVTAQAAGGGAVAVGGINLGTTGAAMGVTMVSSSTTGTPNTGGDNGTPGVPNTGVGGTAAAAWTVLILSALAAIGGGLYLYRTRRA